MMVESFETAPDFPGRLTWIHAERPLSLAGDLAGHVVVIDFWTSCCINCLHVLPSLRFLEERFRAEPFAVIGVHSAKFEAEQDPAHVARAVRQLDIRHPVVIDEGMAIWRAYRCRAWPTIVVVDARGRVRFKGSGEPDRERLALAVEALLAEAREAEVLASEPFRVEREDTEPAGSGLLFPGKLLFDEDRDLLWVADTGHHRVVGLDQGSGEVRKVIGEGKPGASDGAAERARFCSPQGLAIHGDRLFVADTGNHQVRMISLADDEVVTVLGHGRQGQDREGGLCGTDQALDSPWDLCVHDEMLYLAMAGTHQIWCMDLETMIASAHAGSGAEGLLDGELDFASLAQPSGLAVKDNRIAFADSESSAVRVLDLDESSLQTLLGTGLFDFGDRDGALEQARLQHPLDVAFHGEDLLVADTYNDKIKRIKDGRIETLAGPEQGLCAPEGLAVHGEELFVANTGRHEILRIRLADGAVSRLPLAGLPAAGAGVVRTKRVSLRSLSDATLRVPLVLAQDARLHPEVPIHADVQNHEGHPLLVDVHVRPELEDDQVVLRGLPMTEDGEGALRIRITATSCVDTDGVCHFLELERIVPVLLEPQAKGDVVLEDA